MSTDVPQDHPAFTLIPATSGLTKQAKELNEATKRLNEVAEDIEATLQKLNIGVSAFVSFSGRENDSSSESLGYSKLGNRWGLVIRTYQYDGGGDCIGYEDSSFFSVPRDTRINAIGQITELLKKLSSEAAALTERLNKNLSNAETVSKLIRIAITTPEVVTEKGGRK